VDTEIVNAGDDAAMPAGYDAHATGVSAGRVDPPVASLGAVADACQPAAGSAGYSPGEETFY
jgi:hypothetical protein